MSDTICQGCEKKAKWLIGNKKIGLWLCENCDALVEETGKLPEKVIKKNERRNKR